MEKVFYYVVTERFIMREESIYTALRLYGEEKEFWPGSKVAIYRSFNHIFNKEESELIAAYLYLPQEIDTKITLASKWGFSGQTV